MIGRKSLLIVITKAVSAMLGFLGLFLITRYFSESAYGQIAYTMSLVGIFFAFADLGFSTAHIKRVNENKDPGECLASFLVIKVALAVCASLAAVSFVLIYTDVLGRPLSDTTLDLVLIFVLYYLFYNVSNVATATFDAFQQTAKTQAAIIMEMVIRVPLIAILAIPRGDTFTLAVCYMIGGMAVMLVSFAFLLRGHVKFGRPKLIRSYSQFALPLAVAVVIGVVYINIDKVALGFFWNSTEVANYSAAQSIMNMLFIFGSALSTLLFPTFSRLYDNGDSRSIREIIRRGERYLSYILTPIVCVFLMEPVVIATVLLSGKYIGAADVMQILSLNVLIIALGSVYSTHIVASNRAKEFLWLSILQLALLLALLVVFVPTSFFSIPMLGMRAEGTALAVLLTTFTTVALLRVMVWRLTGLGFNLRMGWHVAGAMFSLLLLFVLGLLYDPSRWYDILILWGVSCLGFYPFLYLVRELEPEDVRYFSDVLNPKKMLGYLRSEIKGKK